VPFDIEEIVDDVSGEWVYRDRDVNRNWQVAHADFSTLKPLPLKNIKIEFLTPVFLKRNKRPVYFPVMAEVLSAIIRRVHILSRTIWQDPEFMIDKGFIKNLKTGIDGYELKYEKSFKTGGLGNIVELSGFYGKVEYVGDFTVLYPLLKAGEVLHIGSKTSYGLGKYMLLDL
jgi:CRISPR/Cas system endoribonuclease Cas6 (RAMP superfamily)